MGASCCGLSKDVIDTRLPTVNIRSRSTVHTQGSSSSRRSASGSSVPSQLRCRRCGQFGVQHTCSDCRHTFCQSCCALHSNAMWLCITCLCLDSTGFTKDLLMRVKVKDLRDYLAQHGIRTDTCREKEDLVELVLNHRRIPTAPIHQDTHSPQSNLPSRPQSPALRLHQGFLPRPQPPRFLLFKNQRYSMKGQTEDLMQMEKKILRYDL
uniref:E3 ubiquitin-protein ligase RNF34-like n=1 Tax=Myxine glutinosa TaxID=7769 RepID=UPI0035900692